ncbi:hypothetical protein JYU34_005451 [Plutella xylostella]|uniref:Uncharacterized protein n=1 Tax=Plutella xylostella TaxID=51655 RepID=A0ABQ7QWQ5_PLUXY|nr:hypothetical protein JYU34_005451 [Plutella xylostella]
MTFSVLLLLYYTEKVPPLKPSFLEDPDQFLRPVGQHFHNLSAVAQPPAPGVNRGDETSLKRNLNERERKI